MKKTGLLLSVLTAFSTVSALASSPARTIEHPNCEIRLLVGGGIRGWGELRTVYINKGYHVFEANLDMLKKLSPGAMFADISYHFDERKGKMGIKTHKTCVVNNGLKKISAQDPLDFELIYTKKSVAKTESIKKNKSFGCNKAEKEAMEDIPTCVVRANP